MYSNLEILRRRVSPLLSFSFMAVRGLEGGIFD